VRIPEKPPDDEEINKLLNKSGLKSFEEFRPYLDIVNSKYLHWDEIPMRFKDVGFNLKLLWGYAKLVREFNNRPIKLDGLTLRYVQTPLIEKALHDLDMRVGGEFDFESQMPSVALKRKYLVN